MEIVKSSSTLDKKVESFLSTLLEGYENNIQQVNEFIEQHETQIEGAKLQRKDWITAVDDLKTLLDLKEKDKD